MVRVVSGNRRSQLQNRVAAEERLAQLVRAAMHEPRISGSAVARPIL
jgi:hypothetical protein